MTRRLYALERQPIESRMGQRVFHDQSFRRGHRVRTDVRIPRRYRGRVVDTSKVDPVIDDLIALRTYLVDGGWSVAFLLNYGANTPQIRRLENNEPQA